MLFMWNVNSSWKHNQYLFMVWTENLEFIVSTLSKIMFHYFKIFNLVISCDICYFHFLMITTTLVLHILECCVHITNNYLHYISVPIKVSFMVGNQDWALIINKSEACFPYHSDFNSFETWQHYNMFLAFPSIQSNSITNWIFNAIFDLSLILILIYSFENVVFSKRLFIYWIQIKLILSIHLQLQVFNLARHTYYV